MNVLIFGATGMVGREVLVQCLAAPMVDTVVAIGRRRSDVQHPKLREIEHRDFLDFSDLRAEFSQADVYIYCVGVYQGQVSKGQFWEITVDYLQALISALEQSNKDLRFCLFSAQGASIRCLDQRAQPDAICRRQGARREHLDGLVIG